MGTKADQNGPKKARSLFISPWRMAALRIFGIPYLRFRHRIEFYGQENVPKEGPFILVANHPTYMDPLLIGVGTMRWVHWLAWDELWDWPFVGNWIRNLGAIPVNLEKPGAVILKQGLRVLKSKAPLGIFFEGSRSTTAKLNPVMPGAAMLALRTGTPILPVTISGAYRVWPVSSPAPKNGPLSVLYHPLIKLEKMRERSKEAEDGLTERLKEIIEWPLRDDGRAFRFTQALRDEEMALKGVFSGVKTELETPVALGTN
jgi:1-acyl-sn-glycerol-3-phosphate acyltransferase